MADARLKTLSGPVEDGVREIMREIDRGIKRREEEIERWSKNEQFDRAQHWALVGEFDRTGNTGTGYGYGRGDETTTNLVGMYIKDHRAQVAFNNPRAKYTPKNEDGYEPVQVPVLGDNGQLRQNETGQVEVRPVIKHKVREAIINNMVEAPQFGMQATSGRVVKAADMAYGIVKTGYLPEFKNLPAPDGDQPIPLSEDGGLDFSDYEKSPIDGLPMEDDDGRLIERSKIPLWEDWFVRWVNYRNFILDPDGTNDFADHRWVCEIEVRALADVKSDKMLKNTDDLRGDWGGDFEDDEFRKRWETTEFEEGSEEEQWRKVRLFHFWKFDTNEWIVLADGHGEYLRKGPLPKGVHRHPYTFLCPNEVLGEPYQRPVVSDLAPVNEEYNALTQMELRAAKRNTRKILARKGSLSSKQKTQLSSDEDLEIVEIDPKAGLPMSEMVMPYVNPAQTYDVAKAIERTLSNFNQVSGLSTAARGQTSGGTATETNAQEAHSSTRVQFERAQMREFWRDVFVKLDNSLESNMTVERAVQVEGTDGQVFAGLVDWELIKGDFDVDIDVQDLAPPDDRAQGAQILQLQAMMGQFPSLFSDEVLVRGWCEMYGITDARFIKALVDAAQMQMQMLMMQGAPQPSPEADAPANEADAVSQSAAGNQVPRMQGAT